MPASLEVFDRGLREAGTLRAAGLASLADARLREAEAAWPLLAPRLFALHALSAALLETSADLVELGSRLGLRAGSERHEDGGPRTS